MIDVVLISGPQGSGKTTISNELARLSKTMQYTAVNQVKFANPLYTLHEFILNKMEGWTGSPRVVKDGKLLQLLGTEWARDTLGYDVWVDIAHKEVRKYEEMTSKAKALVIIDDNRFPNEFDKFPEALRVRLECPEDVRKVRCPAWRDNTKHVSETALDEYSAAGKFDLYLNTSGDELAHCVGLIGAKLQKRNWVEKRDLK